MAEPQTEQTDTPTDETSRDTEVGQDQVQEVVDDQLDVGYVGTKVDPRPNEDYALTSGPDSPSAVEDDRTRIAQHSIPAEEASRG